MYTEFYRLSERPFALVPDPRYLFLGSSHREALAHLFYGIERGEGFIEVVGQVGTGKTTLCRTLIDRIGSDVDLAFIFNPSSSEIELLASINREFGISAAGRNRTELIEELNRFLLDRKAAGRRVLLMIDEAQDLEGAVLEQIRLLSNLETEREKLIQIILIGQPELDELLGRADLRQLRQRITVRWSLEPFTFEETAAYLEHRLKVAGARETGVFKPGAVRAIYRASRGVPRLINAVADRALLAGYSMGEHNVGAARVRRAARELPAAAPTGWQAVLGLRPHAVAMLLAGGLLLGLGMPGWRPLLQALPSVDAGFGASAPRASDQVVSAASLVEVALGPELSESLLDTSAHGSAAEALDAILERWGYPPLGAGELDPNRFAGAARDLSPLRVFSGRSTRQRLARLDVPVVLELEPAPDERRYAALVGLSPNGARVAMREGSFEVTAAELDRIWTGRTFFLWTNYESLPVMSHGMTGSAVRWLQARLTELGYMQRGDASGEFDVQTVEAVRLFQTDHLIGDTGEVGPETLIALYQELRYGSPSLSSGDAVS